MSRKRGMAFLFTVISFRFVIIPTYTANKILLFRLNPLDFVADKNVEYL